MRRGRAGRAVKSRASEAGAGRLLAAVPVVFFGLFFLYPLVRVVIRSLSLDGRFDLSPFIEILAKGTLRRAAWFTVWQAAASTLAALMFALPGAYVLARCEFFGKKLFRAASAAPFVLPTVAAIPNPICASLRTSC